MRNGCQKRISFHPSIGKAARRGSPPGLSCGPSHLSSMEGHIYSWTPREHLTVKRKYLSPRTNGSIMCHLLNNCFGRNFRFRLNSVMAAENFSASWCFSPFFTSFFRLFACSLRFLPKKIGSDFGFCNRELQPKISLLNNHAKFCRNGLNLNFKLSTT